MTFSLPLFCHTTWCGRWEHSSQKAEAVSLHITDRESNNLPCHEPEDIRNCHPCGQSRRGYRHLPTSQLPQGRAWHPNSGWQQGPVLTDWLMVKLTTPWSSPLCHPSFSGSCFQLNGSHSELGARGVPATWAVCFWHLIQSPSVPMDK